MFLHAINLSQTNSHTVNEKELKTTRREMWTHCHNLPIFPQACPIKLYGCVSSQVGLGKPFPARARSSWFHTCETRHSDTPPRTELSLSSPHLEWCRQRLGNCDVLGENPQPDKKTRQSVQRFGRFVRAAPPRLKRQTQPQCVFRQGIIGQELGQHVSRVFQSSDFFNLQFFVLNRVLNPQALHLDMSGFASESSPARDPESGSSDP